MGRIIAKRTREKLKITFTHSKSDLSKHNMNITLTQLGAANLNISPNYQIQGMALTELIITPRSRGVLREETF